MAWHIEKQANGLFAIYSTRANDYIVVDADAAAIERIYADKGVQVYVASARAQMTKGTPVPEERERRIDECRRDGAPKEPPDPIGATGFIRE